MTDVLSVELTVGWPAGEQKGLDALELHRLAGRRPEVPYEDVLLEQMQSRGAGHVNMDQLFRRRKDRFTAINQFTAALLKVVDRVDHFKACRIDIFAFAFLKFAKNYDFFMQPQPGSLGALQSVVAEWQESVQALEDYERLGRDLEGAYAVHKEIYMQLRSVVARSAARDEQRTLAVLLASGPATLEDISKDLGLHYSLNQRVVKTLRETGALDTRKIDGESYYLINKAALAVVLFLTREIVGIDLLTMAVSLLGENDG